MRTSLTNQETDMLIKFPDLHILCPIISTFWYRRVFALFTKIKLSISQMGFLAG